MHWFQASGNSALYSNLVQVAALDLDIYFILLLYTTIINLKLTYLMSNSIREIGFNNYLFYKKMSINLSPLKFSFNFCFLFHLKFFTKCMFSYIKKRNWKGIHGIWKRTLTELKNSYKCMKIFIDLFSVIFPGFFFPIPRVNTGIQSHKFII